MGHVVVHSFVGVDEVEDEAVLEGGIETAVIGRSEPDEVGGSVVGGDAVEMMALEVRVTVGSMPGGSDEKMDKVVDRFSPDTDHDSQVLLFPSIVDAARCGLQTPLRQFAHDSGGLEKEDVFAVFGRIKRFGCVTVLHERTVG